MKKTLCMMYCFLLLILLSCREKDELGINNFPFGDLKTVPLPIDFGNLKDAYATIIEDSPDTNVVSIKTPKFELKGNVIYGGVPVKITFSKLKLPKLLEILQTMLGDTLEQGKLLNYTFTKEKILQYLKNEQITADVFYNMSIPGSGVGVRYKTPKIRLNKNLSNLHLLDIPIDSVATKENFNTHTYIVSTINDTSPYTLYEVKAGVLQNIQVQFQINCCSTATLFTSIGYGKAAYGWK